MWKQQQEEEEEEGEGASHGGSSGKAGTIIRIRVENFMCHSNLSVDFSDYVNFITGQNGSGKSAILTALCVAFGIKARGTQRATTLKDFIKTGCTHGLVVVEVKNEGDDAFKRDVYGNKIIIERRMTESGNTFALKDSQGKRVASKKDDLQEIVDHFNIDVENPCVIMTQDKSREFLHGGSGKEKFKFFYRATLLQQVVDLLNSISNNVDSAKAIIEEMEQELNPLRVETSQLEEKLRIVEHFEALKQQLEDYKKMLPWSEVYVVDQKLKSELSKLTKCQDRKPACEARIQKSMEALGKVQSDYAAQKATIDSMLEKTEELRRRRAELENKLSQVNRDKAQIEEEQNSRQRQIKQKLERISWLQQQISDIRDRHVRATQAEELEREQNFMQLQAAIDDDRRKLCSLQAIESELEAKSNSFYEEARSIREEVTEKQQEYKDLQSQIRRLESQRTNKVTAFGGDNVLRLLQAIERNSGRFTKPPLGPIGAHLALTGDDGWALALEFALGRLLNAFIVTNHKDLLLLRDCAKSCGCHNLQIIIYDFNRPRLEIPAHMLPDRNLLTVMAVIHTEIATIMNVLIDQGSVERQVLVKDYDVGKRVIFERRNPNVKEAYTVNGTRMFVRGSTQTTLPPDGRVRSGRLCIAVDHQISQLEEERLKVREEITLIEAKKRLVESNLPNCREELQSTKRRKIDLQRHIMASELRLREQRISAQAEATTGEDPNVDELQQEILKEQLEMQSKEDSLEKFKIRASKAEENIIEAKNNLDQLIESCKGDIQALQDAENSLLSLEESIAQAAGAVEHFRNIMEKKVLPEIIQQENEVARLTKLREETFQTACVVCPEQDVAGMDVVHLSPEMIRSKITRYHDKVRREEGRHDESTDQLRSRIHKRKRRLESKGKKLQFYKEKLEMVGRALQLRQTKFQRNAAFLKRQLQWQFNGHLRKKGMSGKVQVDLSSETLLIQVQMPQDSSNNIVKDTRGLSGGERSFSTLCFTLALHEMTEAPFRAMDEFDVFMDAVSRKISLDTLVDFAVSHGSQWIFITPHDISMIKAGSHVKKQQLAAPRS